MTAPEAPPAADNRLLAEVRVPARADRLAVVRGTVHAALRAAGCDALADDVVLAVDEACQNVVRHAYGGDTDGDLVVRLSRAPDRLFVELRDYAPPVDPDAVCGRDPADVRPGGLGTHFIETIMDDTRFLSPPRGVGNLLRMTKRLPAHLRLEGEGDTP